MSASRLVVVSPMLSHALVHEVDPTTRPRRVTRSTVSLTASPLSLVAAAQKTGAELLCLALVEAAHAEVAASALDAMGVEHDLLVTPAASRALVTYRSAAGEDLFEVQEDRVPAVREVDRLLDRLGAQIDRGAGLVLVTNDLHGAKRRDFAERVVGRSWGLGVRTVLAESGPSVRQAFHTQPFGAVVPAEELQQVSPADASARESRDETLRRIFEDPIRVLLLPTAEGSLIAAARGGSRDLGALLGVDPAAVMAAMAGRWVREADDELALAEAALHLLRG